MNTLQTTTIGQLAAPTKSALATGPFGSAVSSKNFRATGVPMLRGSNLKEDVGTKLNDEELVFLEPELAAKFSRSIAKRGDIVFTNWGSVGQVGIIDETARFDSYIVSNKQMKMTPDLNQVIPLYLYYYLSQPSMIREVKSRAIGSTIPGFNLGQLRELPIVIPPLRAQARIVDVLSSLDDKIAANTKLANIADEWIRAEYDLLTTLSSEHRALSEIVIHRRNTANPEMLEAKVPYVGLEHIPRRLMWLGDHGTSDEVSSNKSHFKSGDILFGKLRPYFHKIVTAPKAGICSTDVLVLTPIDDALSGFALASLAHDGVVQAVTSASEGTRMPRTSWKDLSSINVPWPGQEAAASFSTRVSAIRNYVIGLMAETQTLAATRDALLPLLMSGKLRIKDAEALVDSVV